MTAATNRLYIRKWTALLSLAGTTAATLGGAKTIVPAPHFRSMPFRETTRATSRWEVSVFFRSDSALELGGDYSGDAWRRKNDRAGAAFSLNAISGDHARYLALGGIGFLPI